MTQSRLLIAGELVAGTGAALEIDNPCTEHPTAGAGRGAGAYDERSTEEEQLMENRDEVGWTAAGRIRTNVP